MKIILYALKISSVKHLGEVKQCHLVEKVKVRMLFLAAVSVDILSLQKNYNVE